MNALDYQEQSITDNEISALQEKIPLGEVGSFTEREIAALEYVKLISKTPLSFPADGIRYL